MDKRKILFIILSVIFITSICVNTINAHKNEKTDYVTKVIDGDTIKVSGLNSNVRLWGVDTPELKTAKGKSVKTAVQKLLLNKKVTLDIDDKRNHDHYGRFLAKVYLNGKDINKWLLTKKYARVMYIPPSEFSKYTGGLTASEFKKFTVNNGGTGSFESSSSGTSSNGNVYITPTGTKYHFNKNCRGLNNAKSVSAVSLDTARNKGYTLCGWED